MSFSDKQKEQLEEPLFRGVIRQREQAGRKFDYIEAWHAIAECNRIFGFHGWDRETVHTWETVEVERKIGKEPNQRDGWEVGYCAKVKVTVRTESGEAIIREGTGSGTGIAVSKAEAHESAIKEAESDAMKRALMTFGNQFGLALYDGEKRNVTGSAHALRAEKVWERFKSGLTAHTDPDACAIWYEDPDRQKEIAGWPTKWQRLAEDEYDRHIQSLYGTREAAE